MTCSVSLEQKKAIEAHRELNDAGIRTHLTIYPKGGAKLALFGVDDLSQALKRLRGLGIKALSKVSYLSKDGQFAQGENKEGTQISVYPAEQTFRGCKIVYETVKVPRTVIKAHTETKAKIVCGEQA